MPTACRTGSRPTWWRSSASRTTCRSEGSTPDAPAVRFEGATKRFGTLTALQPLDLTVGRSTLFALVGPNGAGKSTAIGLLTGLLRPTAGRALVYGADVSRAPEDAKRRIGFVPDRPYLWPKWTPREALRFVGAVFGARGDALEERIEMELAAFSLASSADLRNETLSHGTRQRVALAQAFLHDPELFVLDEPMVGLDPIAQKALADRLRSVAANGAAVFFTTHQLSLAEELATRAGLLVKGRLVASGPPSALELPAGGSATLSDAFFDLTRGES